MGAVPEYPVLALPEAARKLVAYGCESGLPAALTGGAALAALATAIGPEASIEVDASFRERAILWVANLAPRGAGKSPAQALAFRPLRGHDAQLGRDDDLETDDGVERGLLLGDTTLEALARRLHASGGGVGLDIDELSAQLRGLGEYKRGGGGDRGRFLSLWTGDPWTFERVGASGKTANAVKLGVHRPTVVICGGLQPALHELLGSDEDGMRPRWLPHLAAMPADVGEIGHSTRVPTDWQLLIGKHLVARPVQASVVEARRERSAGVQSLPLVVETSGARC